MNNWRERLTEELPVLGHRNWIVVADAAYPAQCRPGIETLATGDPGVLYKSWSNWHPDIPVEVPVRPEERGFYGLFSFRKTVKKSIHFTLDPATEDKLFDPANPTRLFMVTIVPSLSENTVMFRSKF